MINIFFITFYDKLQRNVYKIIYIKIIINLRIYTNLIEIIINLII